MTDYRALIESVHEHSQFLSYIEDHHQDSDDSVLVALLLVALNELNQYLAETRKKVSEYLVAARPVEVDSETGEIKPVKHFEVPGLGVVEFKRSTSRKQWRHDDLRKEILSICRANDYDALEVLNECASPTWRVTALRAIGIDPADYALETPGEVSPVLPSRDLDKRGKNVA